MSSSAGEHGSPNAVYRTPPPHPPSPRCALYLPPAPSLGDGPVPSGESGPESKGRNGQTRPTSLEMKAAAPVRTPWPQAERASLCGWTWPVSGADEEAAGHGWLAEQRPRLQRLRLALVGLGSGARDPGGNTRRAAGSSTGRDGVHTWGSPARRQEPSSYTTGYGGLRALRPRGSEGVSLVL